MTCKCGCGETTSIAKQARHGVQKGDHYNYIKGHDKRRGPDDYLVDETGCWVWQRFIGPGGYGGCTRDGKTVAAHRWFYAQAYGPIPEGLHIDHLCRNRACVNPEHLEAVSPRENLRRSPVTKLTEIEVLEIRGARGITIKQLAEEYGVTRGTIANVRSGRTWADVTEDSVVQGVV